MPDAACLRSWAALSMRFLASEVPRPSRSRSALVSTVAYLGTRPRRSGSSEKPRHPASPSRPRIVHVLRRKRRGSALAWYSSGLSAHSSPSKPSRVRVASTHAVSAASVSLRASVSMRHTSQWRRLFFSLCACRSVRAMAAHASLSTANDMFTYAPTRLRRCSCRLVAAVEANWSAANLKSCPVFAASTSASAPPCRSTCAWRDACNDVPTFPEIVLTATHACLAQLPLKKSGTSSPSSRTRRACRLSSSVARTVARCVRSTPSRICSRC
mmetsp:Transcript_64184/g.154912  ORF Transcript_64184/g.154912 Transcript_64184/m.154912 type:complete len:270 (-) Transcript_64184:109-918(-)